MDIPQLIEAAEIKAGGHRALARSIPWNPGALAAGKKKGKVPAWVAGRLAEICGLESDRTHYEHKAAADAALTDPERDYWLRRVKERGFSKATFLLLLFIASTAALFVFNGHASKHEGNCALYTLCRQKLTRYVERKIRWLRQTLQGVACHTILGAAGRTLIPSYD